MSEKVKSVALYVEDMRCDGCAASIKTVLSTISGVMMVSAELETKLVTVNIEPSVSSDTLTQSVQAAGFSVRCLSE